MALFDALGELVGAAVLTTGPVCDLIVPPDVAQERAALHGWLHARGEAEPLVAVVDALAREIWVGVETRGLSQQALEQHMLAIAAILSEHGPTKVHLTQAIERAKGGTNGQTSPIDPLARRIAVDVFARARAAGAVAAAGLKDDVTLFLIDRVYAHLLDDPKTLFALGPALADFIGAKQVREHDAERDRAAAATAALAGLNLSPAVTERIAAAGGWAMLADLRERFGLAEKAMRRLLAHLDNQGIKADDVLHRLEQLSSWIGDVRAQLTKPSNDDADVRRLKGKAAAALAEGDFEAAMEAMRQVRRELREGRRRIEERIQEEVAGLRTQMVEEARATARLAELSLARGEHAEAAELFSEAALALPSTDKDAIWQLQLQRADALYRRGAASRESKALTEAVSAFNQTMRLVADGSNPKGLGHASLGLANTLLLIGEKESGAARLQDAATAYRKAIASIEREDDIRIWADAHLKLGRTLALSGERQQSPAILREAAQAFREALKDLTGEMSPADFAAANMGLGGALLAIEESEGGSQLLTEAAEAYTAALGALDAKAEPQLVAECRMNLGLALLGLGEQQRSAERLEAAAAAFRDALEGYTREAAPTKWALVQMNLGNALAALGDRDPEQGATRLEDAVAAYNSALDELTREGEPLKWAITQMNHGTALIRLGERRDKRKHWLAAAGALVPALEVFENQGADAYADVTRRNLRRFQESWETLIAAPEGREPARARPARMAVAG